MGMKGRKTMARKQRREKAWKETRIAGKTYDGFKKPGSNKKSFPKGKR